MRYNPRLFNQQLVDRESWVEWARKDYQVKEELLRRGTAEPSWWERFKAMWLQTGIWAP